MTIAPVTTAELDELERLEKAATPGEWAYSPGTRRPLEIHFDIVRELDGMHGEGFIFTRARHYSTEEGESTSYDISAQNADFLIALRNAFPALLAAARRGITTESAWADAHDRRYVLQEEAEASRDSLRERLQVATDALGKIARADYRGNRSNLSVDASAALSAIAAKAGKT